MHLKSLTLKGFKSFASATTLRFEPGITCVVGPNGSGKSNVVDALSWVMGEQGAKALRGGKMEDVIFAGTADRPPLGRAEVTLTIDNTDGALPIDYTEVSVTRRMFRDGASEYEINGSSCRLLDVQELLSDSGIGREMHVIVGQGKLDSILQSKPEERRAFIEEAAGVLKHRKRKEKALRKLDAMQANLTRLADLTAELRRQLKPLGKQAEIARRAQAVQADLRDARLRLHADDLVTLHAAVAKDEADEAAARARRDEVDNALNAARAEQSELEQQLAASAPRLAAAQDTWYQLSALAERLRGTVQLAAQRSRHLSAPTEAHRPGRDPDELEREAAAAQVNEAELHAVVEQAQAVLSAALDRRVELEQAVADAERAHLAAARAVADRREGLARLAGQVEALRSTSGATSEEIDRLSGALADAWQRAEAAQQEFDELQHTLDALHAGEVGLNERHESAVSAHATSAQRGAELTAAHREAEQQRASWRARVEALSVGLARKDGTQELLAADLPGVTGTVAALLAVDAGAEAAVAAALGAAADALAVADLNVAVVALSLLREQGAGRAGLLVGGAAATVDRSSWPELPAGARWAMDLVRSPEPMQPALHRLLERTAVVDDLLAARALVAALPTVRAVTVDGDVLGGDWAHGGSGRSQSFIEVQAAIEDGQARLAECEMHIEQLAAELDGAGAEEAARAEDVDNTLAALHESDAKLSAVAEQLARLGQAVRSASGEAERLRRQRDEMEQRRAGALSSLAEMEERLRLAQDEPADSELDTCERDEAVAALATARSEEVEARLALRTAEERAQAVAGRAEGLRRSAQAERVARQRAAAVAAARQRGAAVADEVVRAGELALGRIEISLRRAVAERDAVAVERAQQEQGLAQVRAVVRELAEELDKLTDTVHRDELLRAAQRLRIEQLETKISDDFGIGLDDLVAEYGPAVPVPPSAAEMAEYELAMQRGEPVSSPQPVRFDREMQSRRAQRAERDLALLGKVNPLALEEFAALEERYRFLSTQLEDLKSTRRDLLTVIAEVDEKILEVFTEAFYDVAREFETVFATLFPGGDGRLLLTEPDDMLTTGIEVEARPPGKKVKRLSLLSGGEKALTAVAMLVAIFRARPSPFYVLDEVEAALDDTNLNRLIALFELLRDRSQLIVITHQKATMEVADALYGVSMRGDGVTTVISQRLRGAAGSAGAA
ncbi:MAG: chromosome segregation protein SMC [Pseudonocardiales bacterium]|nr:chromosome segregation protein SMC [Pseudonocardiales bacterium]